MAENEQHFTKTAEKFYRNGQIEHAIANPENIAMQNLFQEYPDIKVLNVPDYIKQEYEEIKQNKVQNESKLDQITDKYKTEKKIEKKGNDSEIEQKVHLIANNSFQMRLKVLKMELKVVETFSNEGLIVNENDILINIEKSMCLVYAALNCSNHEKAENELLKAENLSYQVMRQIKMIVKKRTLKKEEVQKPEEDMEVPDYRSIVTVRGTPEDVTNCILKAKRALENSKYDRAERLLLKAERIFPTKNARDLLKQVRAVEEPTLNTDPIEKATEAVEQVNNFKIEEPKLEGESANADKCLTAFEKAFSTDNFEKAKRMLHKAKRFDSSLDVEQKLSQVKAAIANKIIEDQRKEEIEKAKTECKTAGECLYKSLKAYGAGDFLNAEQYLLQAKSFDPFLNLETELSAIRTTKIDSKTSKENKDIDETGPVSENDQKYASDDLYNAKLAYDAGDFKTALQKFYCANTFDKTLYLESYLSKCKAEIASRSSTEGNTDIPNKVADSVTTITKEDVMSSEHYFKEAQIACQNKNLNETKRLLTLEKLHHSCPDASVMLEYIDEKCGKNQSKPSHEITTSETQFSCLEDEKQKEVELQLECNKIKKVIDKEKSKIKKNNQSEMSKPFEDQKRNLEHTDRGYTSGKDNKGKKLNKMKLQEVERFVKHARNCISKGELETARDALQKAQSIHATPTVKSLMEQVEKDLGNLKKSNYSSKRNADLKTTKLLPKKEQVKILISMAEKEIKNKNFEEAMRFLNTAEELHPTEHAKDVLKNISKTLLSREETHVHSNCYELPVESNESNETEALKCSRMAQAAFQEHQYDRAEHLLLKSLRICYSQKAESLLKTVQDAKAHCNTNTKTKKSCNAHINYQSMSDKKYEYNKCIDVATNASAEGDLVKAERFLSKAIRIIPNDDAQEQLQHIQGLRATQSHPSRDGTFCDVDLKRQKETNMFINRAFDATNRSIFHVARLYFERAYEIQPNEVTLELLQDVQKQIDRSPKAASYFQPNHDLELEANKLLDEIVSLINSGNLEEAESFLTISWDMNRSRRTTFILMKFLEARLTRGVGSKDGNSENILESDKLVQLALDKIKNNKLKEAEKLLMRASEYYRSGIIDKLLVEIKPKTTTFGNVKNFLKNFF